MQNYGYEVYFKNELYKHWGVKTKKEEEQMLLLRDFIRNLINQIT